MLMKPNKSLSTTGIVLLIITSINALAAGFSMMVEPTGNDLGMTVDTVLQYSPFTSFLIPGITLFTMLGVLSVITIYSYYRKWKNYDLLLLAQGFIISGWIMIQVIFLREFNWMHFIIGSIGLYTIFWGYLQYRFLRKKA